jgi:5-methyltetrahydrofolate--homocysteine methyltransferase
LPAPPPGRRAARPARVLSVKPLLHEAARDRRLVCDGAMGTELMAAGLDAGGCGEAWNLTHPERVLAIQRRYAEAGADCLLTNTFGASRVMLRRHGQDEHLRAINEVGVRIAREALGERDGWVVGDIGPLGAILEPYGDLPVDAAKAAYAEQAAALVDAGADAVILETQTSLEELGVAIDAAREAGAPCVIASLAYDLSADRTFHVTMMGVLPERAAGFAEERGAHMIGLNCGTGLDMAGMAAVVRRYRAHSSLPTMGQPNAGLPVLEGGRAVYRQTPAEMVAGVPEALEAGLDIVGSCCGSTPEHTGEIRRAVDAFERRRRAAAAS